MTEACDVVVVGGGPAGSSCAWALGRAGLDVVVIDKAQFPRDKTCAGWITPPVLDELQIDVDDYRNGRTFQPITSFRVGVIGCDRVADVSYDRPLSFGIRRCEFDNYLLRRCAARLQLGTPVSSIRRSGRLWVVDDRIEAPMLVGAAGHFCPVARVLNDRPVSASTIAAQEAEFAIDGCVPAKFAVVPERPELYFCREFDGYGWCFRKQNYVNIGFGRIGGRALPAAVLRNRISASNKADELGACGWRWHGHAYLTSDVPRHRVGDGVLLVGDSAGLAYPSSGEGIRPAIESGLLAAATICEAKGDYSRDRLQPYERRLQHRFEMTAVLAGYLPRTLTSVVGRYLLRKPSVVRALMDRWFLHADEHRTDIAPMPSMVKGWSGGAPHT